MGLNLGDPPMGNQLVGKNTMGLISTLEILCLFRPLPLHHHHGMIALVQSQEIPKERGAVGDNTAPPTSPTHLTCRPD